MKRGQNGLREIITYIENCCDVQRDIDVAYDKLCHVIMNEMKTYLNRIKNQGTKSHKKRRKYKEYWDNDLQNLWNRVCAKEKQFIKSKGGRLNKQMLRTEYLDAQRQFDKLLRIKDRQNRREKLIKLESIKTADSVTFWKEINQLGPSRANTIPMRVCEGGTITTDKNKVLHKWATDFESLHNVTQEAQSTFNSTFHKDILDTVRRYEHEADQEDFPNIYLNDQLSYDEVEKAVRKLQNGKSPGLDNIPNEILKNKEVIMCLWYLYRKC